MYSAAEQMAVENELAVLAMNARIRQFIADYGTLRNQIRAACPAQNP